MLVDFTGDIVYSICDYGNGSVRQWHVIADIAKGSDIVQQCIEHTVIFGYKEIPFILFGGENPSIKLFLDWDKFLNTT